VRVGHSYLQRYIYEDVSVESYPKSR
jgi:hypothetical protein